MAAESPFKLVTSKDADVDAVVDLFERAAKMAREKGFQGAAVVMISRQGTAWVGTHSVGHRMSLLGAVADLQYTLAKQGD